MLSKNEYQIEDIYMLKKNYEDVLSEFGRNKETILLFKDWFDEAKKSENNDPNAAALGTINKNSYPTVRIVLLKDFNNDGFVFYTNLNSDKSKAIIDSPKISAFI